MLVKQMRMVKRESSLGLKFFLQILFVQNHTFYWMSFRASRRQKI